jgi:hypothetical protein
VIALDERDEKVNTADEGRSLQLDGVDDSQAARSMIYIISYDCQFESKEKRNIPCQNLEFQNPVTYTVENANG